ncbi:hypothetical protein [Roseateles puraquae]|jgi:hypothetical protein
MEGFIMTCTCQTNASAHVPDFSVTGFRGAAAAPVQLEGIQALDLSFCVEASTAAGNQICFSVPVFGRFCVTSPIPIPAGAQLRACGETCGSFIPTGLKVTIYLNGNVLFSTVVWGSC